MHILSDDHLQEAASVIHAGGIVAHATETCYGLACDLTNAEAVQKLFKLKKRPEDLPVSALFSSVEEIKKWVEWNEKAQELAEKYWPGPLTIVLPVQVNVHISVQLGVHIPPRSRLDEGSTVGVRVSSHPIAQKLAELCGVPLSTTSANLHGKPEPYSAEEVAEQLQPDLILDSGLLPHAKPSTVVVVKNSEVEVVREGIVEVE